MKKIELTQGRYALVDDEDYEKVSKYKWYASKPRKESYSSYAKRSIHKNNVCVGGALMHRYILGVKRGQIVDHINGDGLDNRKENLRICTQRENSWNSSLKSNSTTGYKGVSRDSRLKRDRYYAYINESGKKYHIGVYDTPIQAAEAYNKKAKEIYGKYAKLNTIK